MTFAKTSAFSVDTNRPLVGKIDKNNQQFILTRIRPAFRNFLPQILMYGILISKGDKTEVQLGYRFGIFTTAFFLFLVYMTGQVISQTVDELKSSEEVMDAVIWLLLFPLGAVLLSIYEINKSTKEVMDILGIDEPQDIS